MVQVNWKRIHAINNVKNEDVENLSSIIVGCDVEQVDNVNNLHALLKVSQGILKLKFTNQNIVEERNVLREKLQILHEEMKNTTTVIDAMTETMNNLNSENIKHRKKIDKLTQEKHELLSKVKDIFNEQADKDLIIDKFITLVDKKLSGWKKENNNGVHNKLPDVQSMVSLNKENDDSRVASLNKEIISRDKIIAELESKLLEASRDITDSAETIMQLKQCLKVMRKNINNKDQSNLINKIKEANDKISSLIALLNQTEHHLATKSQRLCQVMDKLKKYEKNDGNLMNSIEEIKKLKKKINSKNRYIEKLIYIINELETLSNYQKGKIDDLQTSINKPTNELYIEQLMPEPSGKIEKSGKSESINEIKNRKNLKSNSKSNIKKSAKNKRKSVDQGYSSIIHWIANQESYPTDNLEVNETVENIKIIIDENKALRVALREILSSIHIYGSEKK